MAGQPRTCLKRRRPAARATAAACTAFLLISCSAPVTPSPSAPAADLGGTLRIGLEPRDQPFLETIRTFLDPAGEPDPWFRRCCTARTLLSYQVAGRADSAEGEGAAELVPDLATALPTVTPDGLSWTVNLRPGLRYAPPFDDFEIGSADIVRSIERITLVLPIIPAVKGLDEFLEDPSRGIAGLETPDSSTLVVRLARPDGDFPHRLALSATAPVPAAAVEEGQLKDFVSSGPYMVKQATEGGALLVRNPRWSRSSDRLRPAYVDQIEIVPVENVRAAQDQVAAGTLDLTTAFLDARAYRRALRSGEEDRILSAQDYVTFQVPFNVAHPPFDDIHVRRAVALALDRRALADGVEMTRGTLVQVADHIFPDIAVNGLLSGYDPFPAAGESGNLSAAQAEMRLSRYDSDQDGRCDQLACDGVVVLSIFDDGAAGRAVAQQLRPLGITLVAKTPDEFPPDPATYAMAAVAGWGAMGPMPTEYSPLWLSGDPEGGANLTLLGASADELRGWGYRGRVPSLDSQTQFCAEHAGSSAFRCWAELDQLLMEQVVALVPIGTRLLAYRISDRVTAVEVSATEAIPALDTVQVAH
jgi:ABC-type transport system substrate-binding protein